jgi:hypothetical protein
MKQRTGIIRFLAIGFMIIEGLSACSPNIVRNIHKSYPALDNSVEVKVIHIGEIIPFKYETLGTIILGDGGMTSKSKCNYETLLALAIEESKKIGGNAIKIVVDMPPRVEFKPGGVFIYRCHSLSIFVLKIDEE